MKTDPERFILDNTEPMRPPHVSEIALHLASEVHDLWLKTEEDLDAIGLPPPFWAFAWAGGQGLARHILDNPDLVVGRRVLDFASGSGLVAIAAAKAGAAHVIAADIDPWAATAIRLNASLNHVTLDVASNDVIGHLAGFDILLAGDVFYDQAFAQALLPWFSKLVASGVTVLVGDPGRSYCPRDRMRALAVYEVPVTRMLEDSEVKRTTVWAFEG